MVLLPAQCWIIYFLSFAFVGAWTYNDFLELPYPGVFSENESVSTYDGVSRMAINLSFARINCYNLAEMYGLTCERWGIQFMGSWG